MTHRFLLCVLLLSLVAIAQPDERDRNSSGNTEGWTLGFGSEEGGSGSSYMGVDIDDVTPERLSALKLKEEHGAEITMVDEDAPAGKAGLHEHDVILSLNGTTIESAAQLRRMIKETPPGRVVTLGISRDGQPLTIKVQLADRSKENSWKPDPHQFNFHMPEFSIPDIDLPVTVVMAHSSLRSGLMVENITSQLGEFFGVKDGKGVLVRSVEKGSRGEKAGFRAGDVIVKVNNQPVHDASDFSHALHGTAGTSAAVTIMRDKHEQNLTLTLPEKKDSGRLLEGSFDTPDFTEETQRALSLADNEVARLDTEKLQKDMAGAREALECARTRLEEQQARMQKSLEEQQKRMRDQSQRMRDQSKRMLDQSQKVLELQQKLRGLGRKWAEI